MDGWNETCTEWQRHASSRWRQERVPGTGEDEDCEYMSLTRPLKSFPAWLVRCQANMGAGSCQRKLSGPVVEVGLYSYSSCWTLRGKSVRNDWRDHIAVALDLVSMSRCIVSILRCIVSMPRCIVSMSRCIYDWQVIAIVSLTNVSLRSVSTRNCINTSFTNYSIIFWYLTIKFFNEKWVSVAELIKNDRVKLEINNGVFRKV